MIFAVGIELANVVAVQGSHDPDARHHRRPAVAFGDQKQGFDRSLPLLDLLFGLRSFWIYRAASLSVTSWRPRGSGMGSSNGRFQAVALGEAMRALLAQLRDFEIANCLIKADRTHNDGKRSHERPSQRRASGDRASDNPNAKGNDTYRD
jgi:hypothetical protein